MLEKNPASIGKALSLFLRTRHLLYLVGAATLTMKHRRVFEVLYGIFCFVAKRPGRVRPTTSFDLAEILREAKSSFVQLMRQRDQVVRQITQDLDERELKLSIRPHGFALTSGGFIAGEYVTNSARVFVQSAGGLVTHQCYEDDAGVTHIHSVLLHDGRVFVSTGDSNKYLDRYGIVTGELCFEQRVLRHLGGFTTCCELNGMAFFGTDFSERPNYIYCLQTRGKYFFPHPAFTQYCQLMFALDEHYLFCVNRSLSHLSARKSISVFDTRCLSFVYCEKCSEDDFED